MVSAKTVAKRLIRLCSYSMKAFTTSKLMTLISDRNKTNPNMEKASSLYHSSHNFPSSTFFLILASMTFHLNPSFATPTLADFSQAL
jgi:hypothetical protein